MNKDKIIKKSATYSKIISEKQFVRNIYFSIYYQKSTKVLYGITVPKKYGKSYQRNKIKRQIKNIIINNEKNIKTNYNYVIIIKEASKNLKYQQLAEELLELFKKVRD